ncbi:MAG: GyrI-like domain-containing protein [Nitrospinota bacterium]
MEMEVRELAPLRGFGFRLESEASPERIGQQWGRLLLAAERAGRRWAGRRIGLRHVAKGEGSGRPERYEGLLLLEGEEKLEGFEPLSFAGGLYALFPFRGAYHRLEEGFERILREGRLPAGLRPGEGPWVEHYLGDPREVPEGELRVELGIPVERA